MTPDELTQLLRGSAARIIEHTDSVLILATRQEGGETYFYREQQGNLLANEGAAREFLAKSDELLREHIRKGNT